MLAIPVACVAWTVTHEEIFREPREFCETKCKTCPSFVLRKFFYLFTCEYCFSHYVAALALWFTHFKLLIDDWKGYVLALFALVWVANVYMNLFAFIRVDLRLDRGKANVTERQIQKIDREMSMLKADRK